MRTWQVGVTGRGPVGRTQRRRHAYTTAPASQWGRNVRALCRASIQPLPVSGLVFEPEHELACPKCVRRARTLNG